MESLNTIINLNKSKQITNENTSTPVNNNQPTAINYVCSACRDTGYVLIGSGLEMKAKKCNCLKQKSLQRKIKSARISSLLRKCTFDQFDFRYYSNKPVKDGHISYRNLAEKSVDSAASFVHYVLQGQIPDSLLFVGETGRGKSYLAASIANEILEQKPNTQLLFIVVPDLLNEIRSTYDKNTIISEYEIIDAARNSEILILDDLGAHNYSDWVKDKLYSIIDYRLQEHLPTVITTNLIDPPSMNHVLGERITSRIFQLCKVYRMMCERDIRLVNSSEQMRNVINKNE